MEPDDDSGVVCDLCKKSFKRRSAMYYHIRRVHKLAVEFINRKNKFKCPHPSCLVTFHLANLLRNHITEVHGIQIEMCEANFNTYDEFKAWKDAIQDETKSLYTSCQNIRLEKYRRYMYTCYRSGGYIPSKASGKRKLISKKIDGWCPAGMEVKAFNEGRVHVKYFMTHFGHECEVDRLNLSNSEKFIIAEKLKEGLSFEKILDDVRDSAVDGDDIKRIHLLSRRDLNNISKSLKISKKDILNKDEGPTINAWVQSMEALGKDSPVIFFKKKGSDHMMLKNYDYLVVIMTKVQQRLLEMSPHHIVCLDDIRITLTYNFHLVTLMAIDDFDVACPLAFGVANKVDENVISLILEIINSKVGRITTNIFMSSDIQEFYSTWQKHMGPAKSFLLCSWQVERDWRKALEKLPVSKEKKGRFYTSLKQLMIEPNFAQFRSRLDEVLRQLEADADLRPFLNVFKTRYMERNELWAFCYRSQQVLHYNAILELVHKNLIECYEEGRVSNSFVKPLNSIFRFCRAKALEKLKKLPRELQICTLGNISRTNQDILEIILPHDDGSEKLLQVPVVEADGCFVEFNTLNTCPSNCILICSKCDMCFHKFTCTCVENFVNLNICSHIIASVNMMKKQCSSNHNKQSEEGNENTETVNKDDDISIAKRVECTRENSINNNAAKKSPITMNIVGIVCNNIEGCANFNVEHMNDDRATIKIEKKSIEEKCEQGIDDCSEEVVTEECIEEVCNEQNFVKDCDKDNMSEKEFDQESEEELETTDCDADSYKSFLLQKVVLIHDMLKNRTFKPEDYKIFDEYLDKIIVSSYSE